ncbi:TetR family transcriptional regulator C-terminal domain-containing protein [Halopseudomonas bauzanensis]|uniref:Transcriptional regulator, TetR family n=1 Tax=Halopseudomonas bauzanensis TaxID=653930 RepID=A0A031M3A8_9GAMM|nr:TetR family transcriptional regulator C-terminal domain-containing protein [Halopseudomonas bauzanensis]EZQ13923.1 TetR family transcriptional regulator [Halopseudomonas bauzanensis]SES34813.1 transcriptional regulator, TetR family [Halopseudomonas bauzanensis]SFM36201.1 transcriptional regulator, TetR family [Halopseudomonas bauzanensis]
MDRTINHLTESNPSNGDAAKPRKRSNARKAQEARILDAAETLFAQYGYNGASIEAIAEQAGLSKQNMLYYFPSKENLYQHVLKNVLDLWVEKMTLFEQTGDDPASKLRSYILGKLELSHSRPNGSKIFANEIINGAPYIKDYLLKKLLPKLDADIALVNKWIADGLMDAIDPYHLFFSIWATTQTYADFSTQIALVLRKDNLDASDFAAAGDFLTHTILKGTGLSN